MGEASIPTSVYIVIGTVILANLGTIVTLIFAIFKAGRWVGETEGRIKKNEKDVNNAHKAVRELRDVVYKSIKIGE